MQPLILALIAIHILMGIVHDISLPGVLFPFVDLVACRLFADAHEIYVNYGNDIMKPACKGIHYAEEVAGYAYPWLGRTRATRSAATTGSSVRRSATCTSS